MGYIEGQNIAIVYRYAEGKVDRFPELAAELVRLKVDIIVAVGGDRVDLGGQECDRDGSHRYGKQLGSILSRQAMLKSLARPGGNVTGPTNLAVELGGKRLELLKEAVPKLARVAVLYDPTSPSSVREVKEDLPVAASALRLTIQPWEVRAADGFEKVFAALNKQRPDGLYVPGSGSPLMSANRKRIVGFALKSRLPSIYEHQSTCRCRWPHVLRGEHRGQLPARRILRRQNSEGRQASRPARGAADEVRVGDQSEDRQGVGARRFLRIF